MARKRIAVLVASIDREYQQDFASGLLSAGVQNDVDICLFNSQGHGVRRRHLHAGDHGK